MTFISNKIKEGDEVHITEEIENMNGIFTKGHKFKVLCITERGYNLEDKDGNVALEVPFGIVKQYSGY